MRSTLAVRKAAREHGIKVSSQQASGSVFCLSAPETLTPWCLPTA
jgi:hypothetical protein